MKEDRSLTMSKVGMGVEIQSPERGISFAFRKEGGEV